jgi:hypothetical protein
MNNSKVRMEASLLWFPGVQYYFQLEQVFIVSYLFHVKATDWSLRIHNCSPSQNIPQLNIALILYPAY